MAIYRGDGGAGDADNDVTVTTITKKAQEAKDSATEAANSASAAFTSAENAAISYDNFDDRYLGAKASDPTLDNDGDALITGALYFNTVSNAMQVYNGTAWTALTGTGAAELNDLTTAVTWANVPDANITESSVTQHEAALSITESQISDLGSYITASSTDTLTNKSGNISQWTNDSAYLTGNQTITLSGDATGSGTTAITVTVADDSHNHIISNVDGLQTALDAKGTLSNVVEDTTPQLGGTLDANGNTIDMGVNVISDTKVGQWDTAYSWGNHASAGYLTSYTETDPVYTASSWYTTTNNSTQWDTAYSWGDHSLANYLTSYTETDPVYTTSSWYTTTNNSSNWDTAYGWGDHSLAGYLTSFTETNDLSTAVTWANVPDANITQSSVTQHQAALSITESQISDLDHYTDADVDTHLNTGTATSSQVLSWTGTDYDWVDAASGGGDLVDDTTPQLGGDLDTNGNNINFGDNDRAQFGASSDLQIFHDGSNSIITDLGTGDLLLGGNKIALMDAARTIKYAQGQGSDGSITLYKSDSPKLQTTATGVTVTGTVTATAFSGDGSALTGISGGGKILQVVFNHVDTIASYLIDSATPDTTQQIAALNTSITPTASDSKILVTFSFCGEGNEENVWRLYRGNTEIGRTTQSTSQWAGFKPALSDGSLGWTQTSQHFVYIDSPATTSSITYNIRAAESYNVNNYFRLNRVYNGTNAGAVTQELGTSQVILMEIGA
jgi:hypothetical protein